jgi:hypothetical protein
MGINGCSISTWEIMKENFSKKYRVYFKARGIGAQIFQMTQREDESFEYYAKILQEVH